MLPGMLSVVFVLFAAMPADESGCRMADELKVIAAAKEPGDAFRRAAALLADQGKWRAAATAQESAGTPDDASRLLLAYRELRAGDPDRADRLLRKVGEEQRQSLAGHWVAAEIALERDDAGTAAEELESARGATNPGGVFPSICCYGRAMEPAALDALLRARVALLRDDAAAAVATLRGVETAEGRLFLARARKTAGQTAEAVRELETLAREHQPCAGVWREHLLFEAALAAEDAGLDTAEKLYLEAIEAAEAQETAFTAAVHEAGVDLQTPVTGLFVAATRDRRHAAPESHNNLGHLLLARANGDLAELSVAQKHLYAAAQSRDYRTPHYAHIGLVRAALAAGDREVAVEEAMNALWRGPRHDEALELARTLIREAPVESQLRLGVVFDATASETLPRRFVTREYGRDLARVDEVAAAQNNDLARQYAAVRAFTKNDFARVRELAKAGRTELSSADWPDAVEAAALAAEARVDEARALVRGLNERIARNPPRTPWDAATLRTAALAFSDVVRGNDDPAARAAAASLIAEVARPAVASGRPFPWEARTGLTGSVAAADGDQALPGAEITVFTEDGPQKVIARDRGDWRVRDLPPGFYSVRADIAGMRSSGQIVKVTTGETEVAFALKHGTVTEDITGTVTEEITVTASADGMIDPLRQITRIDDLDKFFVSSPGAVIRVKQLYGASSAQNQFVIDGANTETSLSNARGELLIPSAIQEISIITSGYAAEYGSGSLSAVNAVTRSGTNHLAGKVTVEAGCDDEPAEPVAMSQALGSEREEEISRVHAGGPVQRERVYWFFSGDLQRQRGEPQPALASALTPRGRSRGRRLDVFAKLSGSFPFTLASLSTRRRQADRSGVVDDPAGIAFGTASSVNRREKTRDDTVTLSVNRTFGSSTVADVNASRTHERTSLRPDSEAANAIQTRFSEAGFFTDGGIGFVNDGRDFEETGVRAKVSKRFGSTHTLLGGVDAEWDDDAVSDRISGGMLVDAHDGSRRFWTFGGDSHAVAAVHETFKGQETSAFVSDRWESSHLTVTAGLRWTRQTVSFPRDFELSTSALQPRLEVAVDPDGSRRWNIYANYGRFSESIRRDERVAYGSDRRYVLVAPSPGSSLEPEAYGRLSAIDPDLRARLTDVWAAGVEHGTWWRWQLGGQYQHLASHIEDFFCTPDRRRCIGNPGSGIMGQFPEAKREHLYLLGRIRQNTQGFQWDLAYSWLHAEGNTDPPDLASTRVTGIDPYSRPAFDTPGMVFDGDLALPRHSLRASVLADWKNVVSMHDVVFSAVFTAQSGAPRGAFGYSPLYGRYVTMFAPRGAEGDAPALVTLHAGLDYVIPVAHASLKLSLLGRNLLGSQASRVDDQRAVLPVSEFLAAPNPTFLQPMERNEPRSLRAVVAFTF